MENKCNKTPNNKFLDHVYCHNSESKNYIRANNNNGSGNAGGNSGGAVATGQDVMALLKENKQLKAMLILHLDLIQEQSDQLMAKDKVLNSVREENESVKSKNAQLEAQVQDLQKQLQRQMKRVVAGGGEVSKLPPPPLAKIQCKVETDTVQSMRATTEDVKYVKDEKATKEQQQEKATKTTKKNYIIQDTTTNINTNDKPAGGKSANIIGECNGKLISKIILHRVNTSGFQSPLSTASDSASELEETTRARSASSVAKRITENSGDGTTGGEYGEDGEETEDSNDATSTTSKRSKSATNMSLKMARGAKPRKPLATVASSTAVKVCITPATPSRGGKQMPLMLTHAPELHSDESASCDSIAETEQNTNCLSSPALSLSPKDAKHHGQSLVTPSNTKSPFNQHVKARRGYISTPQRYCTRAWEDEEFSCDFDGFLKDNMNALDSDATPILEIPKWTEHEISASYCIEGTEDLSDETFLKRHAKLEVDEKRRKKWDVQQIREQRRIEKLKRRHCKDELQAAPEPQPMLSFYPPPEAIQMICYVNDLPVQAFGELIPKLSTNGDFMLPWLESHSASTATGFSSVTTLATTNTGTSSAQAAQQVLKSSFAFINKRRRQQSASSAPVTRQRNGASTKSQALLSTTSTSLVSPMVTLTSATTTNANPTELSSN